jgi:hypothetical protein
MPTNNKPRTTIGQWWRVVLERFRDSANYRAHYRAVADSQRQAERDRKTAERAQRKAVKKAATR